MERVIVESYEDIGTEARGWATLGVIFKENSRGSRF
jgi:hypothetical protein